MKKIAAVFLILFVSIFSLYLIFPNCFCTEKSIRKQIKKEYETLITETKPVLDHLSAYKAKNGYYPETIPGNFLMNSKTFDKLEYGITQNKKGYWIEIYPKKGPVEYYYNDEFQSGYNYYNGNGYYDGFLDNEYYYQIDNVWHAVRYEYFTRHSIIF